MAKKKDEPLREAKVVDTEFGDDNDFETVSDDTQMLPNDGEQMTPEQDEEIQEEINEDKAMFTGNEPLVQAVFDWLDNEIRDCDSVEAALAISKAYEISLENTLVAMDMIRKVFTAKRVSFQNIHDTVNSGSD